MLHLLPLPLPRPVGHAQQAARRGGALLAPLLRRQRAEQRLAVAGPPVSKRPLRADPAWNASLYLHLRKVRLEAKCVEGDTDSCQREPFGNDAARMRILVEQLAHQQAVARADSNEERRSRFVLLDLTNDQPQDVWLKLLWALRRSLDHYLDAAGPIGSAVPPEYIPAWPARSWRSRAAAPRQLYAR